MTAPRALFCMGVCLAAFAIAAFGIASIIMIFLSIPNLDRMTTWTEMELACAVGFFLLNWWCGRVLKYQESIRDQE